MAEDYIPHEGPVVTRKKARADGLPTYFTGKPCKHGHIVERHAVSGHCLVCQKDSTGKNREAQKLAQIRYRERHKAKIAEARHNKYHSDASGAREYQRQWRLANPDKVKAAGKKWFDADPDRARAMERARYAKNREKQIAKSRAWNIKNAEKVAAREAARRAVAKRATPLWADQDAIIAIYRDCARITETTGILHHVDHIYPLHGKHVCGLHCQANLQILPAKANMGKGNRVADNLVMPLGAVPPPRQGDLLWGMAA